MRRNPRPFRPLDRRRLAIEIAAREASAPDATESLAIARGQPRILSLNKPAVPPIPAAKKT